MSEERATIGEQLKQARLEKDITLDEAFKKTRIHINVLKAMEEDRLKDYSQTYIKGFLKLYARYLGLNDKEILAQYREIFSPKKEEAGPKPQKPVKPKINIVHFLPKVKVLLRLAIIICIIFIIGKIFHIAKDKHWKAAALKPKAKVVEAVKEAMPKGAKKQTPAVTAKKAPEKAPAPEPAKPPEKKSAPVSVQKSDSIKLAMRANEDCWVQLIVDGKKIFEGILSKGMKESWVAQKEMKLWLGNAGGVELELNDKILSPVGRRGQVVKNILITKEGISTSASR